MKAFLIDPKERSIIEVEYSGDYRDIYKLCDFDTFDVVTFNSAMDGVFVDDEGLLKNNDPSFFTIADYPQPLAGKGLVLGCDEEGASTTPTVGMDWLQNNVRFLSGESRYGS